MYKNWVCSFDALSEISATFRQEYDSLVLVCNLKPDKCQKIRCPSICTKKSAVKQDKQERLRDEINLQDKFLGLK